MLRKLREDERKRVVLTPPPEFMRGAVRPPCAHPAVRDNFVHSYTGRLASASNSRAMAVCRLCPFRWECLAYAEENPGLQGVWGGTTDQMRAARRNRAREVEHA